MSGMLRVRDDKEGVIEMRILLIKFLDGKVWVCLIYLICIGMEYRSVRWKEIGEYCGRFWMFRREGD